MPVVPRILLVVSVALVAGGSARAADTKPACDAELGKQVFAVCSTCHALQPGEPVREGPSLAGFFGQRAGTSDKAFKYSPALLGTEWIWDAATLDRFLVNPRRALRGTTMTFIGLKSADERAAVACFLQQQSANVAGKQQ
ncbi:MAG: c-type cytochrome [Steroidobacteraceae bacterium]|nr:c-type cytochrome [Steroidobacteraceae bacterium]